MGAMRRARSGSAVFSSTKTSRNTISLYKFISNGYIIRLMEHESIKDVRHHLRLTQKRLAEELGVTLATVGRWECGLREPSPLAVRAMDLLLEVERLKIQRREEKE